MDQVLNIHCAELTQKLYKGVSINITLFYKFTNGEPETQKCSVTARTNSQLIDPEPMFLTLD